MSNPFTAIYKKEGDWWVGWVEEIPGVNAQESTKEELFESLKIALDEALEFNREQARETAKEDYEEAPLVA